VPSRRRICNVCTSRLTLTVASAQHIGALAGLAFVGILTPLTFIADGGTVRWIPFAYVLATITTMFAAKLALYDDVRRDPRPWQIVPNVPARRGGILLILPWSPLWWLEIVLELAICVAGVFGSIGMWHLLFGPRGILRRSS
jgi:hypothetical protein